MRKQADRHPTHLFWDRTTGHGAVDLEQEHDGREPSHGSNGGTSGAAWADQRQWAVGGDQGEREDVSEDEGTYRDGDEPDQWPDCVNYLLHD